MSADLSLRITEVFHSLQGETNTVGLPTVFVRLTGCPLRCNYCDTAYAFQGGDKVLLGEVVEKVRAYSARYVTVTGGEPLAQPACIDLLSALCDLNYKVSLETSGALSVAKVDRRVVKVMDLKTPSSTECQRNDYDNIQYLSAQDQVKFVIADYVDYQWSVDCLQRYGLADKCEVLFSPVYNACRNEQLAQWILQDGLPVRFQIQLHKYIWGDQPGR